MNILAKATRTAYIVPYVDNTENTKVINGKTIRTGERTQYYGQAFWSDAYISSPKGLSAVDINGVNVPEQRTMVTENGKGKIVPSRIHEADLVLIPKSVLSQSADDITELLVENGELSSFAKSDFYHYRVSNISVFDYHFRYTLTRIDV